MLKPIMLSLFATSVLVLWASEVMAGCATIGGKRVCASWITGSEICAVTATGLGNVKDCTEDVNCPVLTCTAFGTIPLIGGADCENNFDTNTTACGIAGIAFCLNPAGNASHAQGNPFTFDAVLTDTSNITTCDKNGRCRTSIELDPTNCPECCVNSNWQFITFTASAFNAETKLCPGGYDVNNQCCASINRTGDLCGTGNTATETIVREFCQVDLTGYKPGQQRAYNCVPIAG